MLSTVEYRHANYKDLIESYIRDNLYDSYVIAVRNIEGFDFSEEHLQTVKDFFENIPELFNQMDLLDLADPIWFFPFKEKDDCIAIWDKVPKNRRIRASLWSYGKFIRDNT